MAAAVTSGAVADVLAADPDLGPDDVKALLRSTAYHLPGPQRETGAGGVDLAAALRAAPGFPGTATTAVPGDPATWQALLTALAAHDADAATTAWNTLSPDARAWGRATWSALSPQAQSWVRAQARDDLAQLGIRGADTDEWLARAWGARAWGARAWGARAWGSADWLSGTWMARAWGADAWDARAWGARAWGARAWGAFDWR
jgi:hypothetical protein